MTQRNIIKNVISAALILGVALFYLYVRSPRGMVLVAADDVPVYGSSEEAMASPAPTALATLRLGESVPVVKCEDFKSYFLHEVHLADGRSGFVINGKYTLMREGKQAFCS